MSKGISSINNRFNLFSSAHETFFRIDQILGHKSSLSKFFKIEITSSISSYHSAVRLHINCRGKWHPTPVLLPEKSHGWRSLVGCSPRGHWDLDATEQLHFHFSLSCIGGGSGNPLQCSCLENPRDGGAWWAAVSGVTQSRTRLKRLSSSSSSRGKNYKQHK